RGFHVTGVQTCALPIWAMLRSLRQAEANAQLKDKVNRELEQRVSERTQELAKKNQLLLEYNQQILEKDEEIKRINSLLDKDIWRSEERRVGKEGRHQGK